MITHLYAQKCLHTHTQAHTHTQTHACMHTHTRTSSLWCLTSIVLHLLLKSGCEMGGISSPAPCFHSAPLRPSSITGSQAANLFWDWWLVLDLKYLFLPGAVRIKGSFCSRPFEEVKCQNSIFVYMGLNTLKLSQLLKNHYLANILRCRMMLHCRKTRVRANLVYCKFSRLKKKKNLNKKYSYLLLFNSGF